MNEDEVEVKPLTMGEVERMRASFNWDAAPVPMMRLIVTLEEALRWPKEGDNPLPEDEAIRAAHPLKTDKHEVYAEAMRLVGARRSKGGLVMLVNWLLVCFAEEMSQHSKDCELLNEGLEDHVRVIRDMTMKMEDALLALRCGANTKATGILEVALGRGEEGS